MSTKNKAPHTKTPIEKLTSWVGSYTSLAVHTLFFVSSFASTALGLVELDTMLLVLTTLVSLEAIYLAIFIQISVNNQSAILHEVEQDIDEIAEDVEEIAEDVEEIQEDVDEIQKDVDEIQEDVDEIQKDVDEIQEDVDEMTEEETVDISPEIQQAVTLEKLTTDLQRLLKDIETLKQVK